MKERIIQLKPKQVFYYRKKRWIIRHDLSASGKVGAEDADSGDIAHFPPDTIVDLEVGHTIDDSEDWKQYPTPQQEKAQEIIDWIDASLKESTDEKNT